jgi:hypothetical protein
MTLRQYPEGPAMDANAFVRSALDRPLSPWATFTGAAADSALQTPGLGTFLREGQLPPLAIEPGPVPGIADAWGTVADPVSQDPQNFASPQVPSDQPFGAPPNYDRVQTPEQVESRGDKLFRNEDEYRQSPSYRQGIPFEPGLTASRARALADMHDVSQVRQFYSSKRPVVSFVGTVAGAAVDPINYIPIIGEAAYAAASARVGRIAARSILTSADAALNTAVFSTITANTRRAYGDDVSWNAIAMNSAYAALAGAVLGGAFGAVTKGRLETAENRIKAAEVLNDAIDGLVERGEVQLGTRSQATISDMGQTVQAKPTPDLDLGRYYEVAPARQAELEDFARLIADEVGVEFKTPGIKNRATAEEKIFRKGYTRADQLTDIVRGGFVVESPEAAEQIVLGLSQRFDVLDEGWGINSANYADRKVLLRFTDGTVGEVQIWHKNMLAAKSEGGGHNLYKKWRTLDPKSEEAKAIAQQMASLYQGVLDALPPSFGGTLKSAGKGGKSGNVSWKLASSKARPESTTSAGWTDSQSLPGSRMNQAASQPADSSAGLRSQLTNDVFMGGSPKGNMASAVPVVNAPDNLPQAETKVEARAKPGPDPEQAQIDRTIADAKEEGFDPETGEHDLEPDIDLLRNQEALTADEEAALAAADETYEAVDAWQKVMAVAQSCVIK